MDLAIFRKGSQRLADAVSEFDDAFKDTRDNFVSSPNMRDRQCEELFKAIDSNLSNIDGNVCEIGEKIERFTSSEGIKYR